MQTGEDFMIFQDRKDILWGERRRSRISQSIDATTLLIAVITPAFFKSDVCREELEQFLLREKQGSDGQHRRDPLSAMNPTRAL